jgi:hypothetical protein
MAENKEIPRTPVNIWAILSFHNSWKTNPEIIIVNIK